MKARKTPHLPRDIGAALDSVMFSCHCSLFLGFAVDLRRIGVPYGGGKKGAYVPIYGFPGSGALAARATSTTTLCASTEPRRRCLPRNPQLRPHCVVHRRLRSRNRPVLRCVWDDGRPRAASPSTRIASPSGLSSRRPVSTSARRNRGGRCFSPQDATLGFNSTSMTSGGTRTTRADPRIRTHADTPDGLPFAKARSQISRRRRANFGGALYCVLFRAIAACFSALRWICGGLASPLRKWEEGVQLPPSIVFPGLARSQHAPHAMSLATTTLCASTESRRQRLLCNPRCIVHGRLCCRLHSRNRCEGPGQHLRLRGPPPRPFFTAPRADLSASRPRRTLFLATRSRRLPPLALTSTASGGTRTTTRAGPPIRTHRLSSESVSILASSVV
ncbi:hypothetical protein B0H11DRAFT_1947567 [Mycena galericulata]|nr:hypothetical protein B0H11DRAFT_1947567 [Mycena galericulata]